MNRAATTDDYAVSKPTPDAKIEAPDLPYRPRRPRQYRPRIGLIGCGGITKSHLTAYRAAGYDVVALCDLDATRAQERQREFCPNAEIIASAHELLSRPDIDVVDLALHPEPRAQLLLDAVAAGKHVLSQKPFVLDLDHGQKVVDAAAARGVKLAVNQNGRWAPHVSWMRHAIDAGLIGDVINVDAAIHWDHNWTAGTPFDEIHHLVLYDFAIHWFDMLHCYTRALKPERVFASIRRTRTQRAKPPLLAQVLVDFEAAQASLVFRADSRFGPRDRTVITGTRGTLISDGPSLSKQTVTLYTERGQATPALEGSWFPDGFDGTMSELLCAIEEDREPNNSGRDNLHSLAFAFAAMASADRGQSVRVGEARSMSAG